MPAPGPNPAIPFHARSPAAGPGVALLVAAALATACATPIGVERMDPRRVQRELTASALTSERPSLPTTRVLNDLALRERFADEPEAALAALHEGLVGTGDADRLFALAELSFLHAEDRGGAPWFRAAVVYAYAFLFPGDSGSPPSRWDPRTRSAADLYNRALTRALLPEGAREVPATLDQVPLPFGAIEVAFDRERLTWASHPLTRFIATSELEVRGLRNRYRRAGLGAPLAASFEAPPDQSAALADVRRIPPRLKVPVTAFLRIEEPHRGLRTGRLRGRLEIRSIDDPPFVEVDGRRVPLEMETTAALAATLEGSSVWDLELGAFFSGDMLAQRQIGDGLIFLHPYRPGRVPLVLVHGTASSPARWAELLNELENDPRLGPRIQIWLFTYPSGAPVLWSARMLRDALRSAVHELDPMDADPALHQMVVAGHSQGGMLTRLMVTSSGDRFWANVADEPLDAFDLDPESRTLLERTLFFEPLPFARRVVFIATPHRGSYLTIASFLGWNPASVVTGLIKLPFDVAKASVDLLRGDDAARLKQRLGGNLPTAVDNMTPGNPFLKTLAASPLAAGVAAHSIIAVKGDGPPETGSDGVVRYESAHLAGAESERVVRSGHSVQAHPDTVAEMRRILRVHLDALDLPAPAPLAGAALPEEEASTP